MHEIATTGGPSAVLDRRLLARLRIGSLTRDVLIVSGVALILGLIRLGTPSFWVDEGYGWADLRRPYSYYLEGYYWLFYSIMKPWTIVAGTSEWALRFPSVVARDGVVLAARRPRPTSCSIAKSP